MKVKKKLAIGLAAVMACGLFAGCDLVTTDPYKDYEQVIAEVNISAGKDFAEGGKYHDYADAILTSEISKRDMVASFAANGSSVMSQYGWTYKDTFDAICDSLVNRQVYVQYAEVYFLEKDASRTKDGLKAAIDAQKGFVEQSIAAIGYFLDDAEKAKALYDLRVSFNSSLDSIEEGIVSAEDEHDHDETVRTTPTGVNTSDEDFVDGTYNIFTGTETSLGTYERVDGSTATTRRKAYATFLSNLRSSGLLLSGEDTSKIESLSYFRRELKSSYETKLINKLADAFEEEAEQEITGLDDSWLKSEAEALLNKQASGFEADESTVSTALDGMSDSSFVLTVPKAGYGFVINILLPFSTSQTQQLEDVSKDSGDKKGNKFVTRANLLKNVKATDQRGTWFSGETDYSFESEDGYTGGKTERKYLFFEDCLANDEGNTGTKYEALKNYYGKYTYNGTVTPPAEGEGNGKYVTKPNKITIDDFIGEMERYLSFALDGTSAKVEKGADPAENYYTKNVYEYYKGTDASGAKDGTGDVDYSQFIYYTGHVDFGTNGFNANEMFVKGTEENIALSVINELSFAYNTDTAGLNTYLGYSVTPGKTNFVGEFEYAAHEVCKAGAGHYAVVPSDYGWHIIYCTFSFTEGKLAPFTYSKEDREREGTFSNLYFEAKKAQAISTYTTNKQNEIINAYAKASATIYEDRFADLSGLDSAV